MADEILKDEELDDTSSSLNISDEDFLKAEPPTSLEEEVADAGDGDSGDSKGDEADPDKGDGEGEDGKDGDTGDSTTTGDNSTGDGDDGDTDKADPDAGVDNTGDVDGGDPDAATKVDADKTDKTDKDAEAAAKDKAKADTDEVDYKAEYEKVMGKFNANGVEMKPKSVDDIIRLMQMGANYHKKMAGLKPSMKVLKLLEKNNLLDQEKLNYLIDLNAKDPAAITKLLKDSGMDPLDIDLKEDSTYKPTSRNVSDTEIDLDSVLDSIKGTPSYSKTLNVVTQVWDQASRSIIANTPHIISLINGHVADGTYDKVMGAVEYQRSLGELQGISDLDAYKQMGDEMQNKGELGPTPKADIPNKIKPKVKTDDKAKRKANKKAAGPTRNGGKSATPTFSPLEMSDDELEGFDESKLNID